MILENINYFQEVVNPLYAFPVVLVVLCAVLVFAFGFKTPAQPPSFDFVEHRKVAAKKKSKSKEVKTSKPVQNGNAHPPEPASNTSSTAAKAPSSKPVKNESSASKKVTHSDNKTKQKKAEVVSPTNPAKEKSAVLDEVPENNGSGEWTQQLSRKERKNKKSKEVTENLKNTANLLTVSSKENSPVKSTKEVKQLSQEDATEDKENVEAQEITVADEKITPVVKETTPEVVTSKKAKKKKEVPPEAPVVSEDAEKKDTGNTKSSKDGTSKVKKSPKEPSQVVKDSPKVESTDESKKFLGDMQLETKEPEQVAPAETTAKDNAPKAAATEETSVEPPKTTDDSAKQTSNVVFDELGDMWQDAKPQKKKKKVRRE